MKSFTDRIKPTYRIDVIQKLDAYQKYGGVRICNVLAEALVHKGGMSPEKYNEHLIDRMQNEENLKFYVLKQNEEIVAVAMGWRRGTISNGPRIQLQCLAVAEQHRGKGLFNRLTNGILNWCGDNGFKGLDIEVGMNSLPKTTPVYLHAGCSPDHVLYSIDNTARCSKTTFAEKEKQKQSIDNILAVFGEAKGKFKD